MKNVRIIPRLDIKGPNLVKGIHLEGLRVLGLPEHFAKFYYDNGADELIYQDTVASLYGRNSLNDIITRTAKNIFIPLTVGGGIRNLKDINGVLRAGADKVSINTAAISDPNLIKEASKVFGSSTIVVAIEAIKTDGKYLAYTDNGREFTGIDAVEWAKRVQDLGAGEILLTSIDKEGTGEGFDDELISNVSESIEIPLIAHGGAGSLDKVWKTLQKNDISALAISSIFHYSLLNRFKNDLDNDFKEGNLDFIKKMTSYKNFGNISIIDFKKYLLEKKISVRQDNE
jgi:cyclase